MSQVRQPALPSCAKPFLEILDGKVFGISFGYSGLAFFEYFLMPLRGFRFTPVVTKFVPQHFHSKELLVAWHGLYFCNAHLYFSNTGMPCCRGVELGAKLVDRLLSWWLLGVLCSLRLGVEPFTLFIIRCTNYRSLRSRGIFQSSEVRVQTSVGSLEFEVRSYRLEDSGQ